MVGASIIRPPPRRDLCAVSWRQLALKFWWNLWDSRRPVLWTPSDGLRLLGLQFRPAIPANRPQDGPHLVVRLVDQARIPAGWSRAFRLDPRPAILGVDEYRDFLIDPPRPISQIEPRDP